MAIIAAVYTNIILIQQLVEDGMAEQLDQQLLIGITKHLNLHLINRMVFGEPIINENVLIIPVSKARFGFGFGRGRTKAQENGEGGGGGVSATPVGYIEIKDGESKFVSIRPSASIFTILLSTSAIAYLLLKRFANL